MGKIKEHKLVTLINANEFKLDENDLYDALINEIGQGKTLFYNLGFNYISSKFAEKNEKEAYSLSYEISLPENDTYFLFGENGLFLKTMNSDYFFVESILEKYKAFIGMCRLYLYKPIGVIHVSDGDSFINPAKIRNSFDKRRLECTFKHVEWFEAEVSE